MKMELIITCAHPHVVMIGEAGFDRLRGPAVKVQHEIFHYQAELAEEMKKPLLIHCVRHWDELARAYKEINHSVPWIIHGFRGKSDLAASLADKGFWFSLGHQAINPQILKVIDSERILLETDDSMMPVADVYKLFSEMMQYDDTKASDLIRQNFNSLFEDNL
jgi:TatD DNase family protein